VQTRRFRVLHTTHHIGIGVSPRGVGAPPSLTSVGQKLLSVKRVRVVRKRTCMTDCKISNPANIVCDSAILAGDCWVMAIGRFSNVKNKLEQSSHRVAFVFCV